MDVFARIPEEITHFDIFSEWSLRQRRSPLIGSFLEGPVLDGRGGLYCVDIARGRLFHVDDVEEFSTIAKYGGEPNGLTWRDSEELVVTDFSLGLIAVDVSGGGRMRVLRDHFGPERFKGVNDLAVAQDGRIYFTDQGGTGLHDPSGRVFCLMPDGHLEIVLETIPSPNGVLFDEDSESLLVAATRDNGVWRVPLFENGAHKVGRFLQFSGGQGPDGLAWGPEESVVVAHLGLGTFGVYDRLGRPAVFMESPEGRLTTNAIVSQNHRVYATESHSGTILTADLAPYVDRLHVD